MLRLATQVQARTQQPTAMGGRADICWIVRMCMNLAGPSAKRKVFLRQSATEVTYSRGTAPRALGWFDMVQRTLPMLVCCCWRRCCWRPARRRQDGPFQIVWVVIGEASSGSDKAPAHAGRQLFMASDLVSKSLANVKVEQVDVEPVVNELAIGQRLCLAKMNIRTAGSGQGADRRRAVVDLGATGSQAASGPEPEQTRYLFATD